MNRRSFTRAIACVAASACLPGLARADDLSDVLRAVTRARTGLKTVVASFTQERTIGLLAATVKSDGELSLVLPSRLRWELFAPDSIVYFIGPEGIAYATPSGGVTAGRGAVSRFGAILTDLMVLFGDDLEKLRSRYDIVVRDRKDGLTLGLTPKAEDLRAQVKSLELRLGPELWTIRTVRITEAKGDTSVITFRQMNRDVPVDAAKMIPPSGK